MNGGRDQALTLDFTSVGPHAGGVGIVASGVAQGLRANGSSFRCVVSSQSHAEWSSSHPELVPYLEHVAVRLAATSDWQRILRRFFPRESRLAQATIGRIRTIRARSTRSALGAGVTWQPFHRVPITNDRTVVTVHDLRVFEEGLASPMDQAIIERNVRMAAALVCSWPHPYDNLLERFPFAREKTFLIPLPVLNPGPWKERASPPLRSLRLLTPGFVTPHKNHEVIIRALPMLPGARAVFTGSEDGSHGAYLRDIARSSGVADRIDWLGFVDADTLESEYQKADLLVMPTRWEAASGPLFEAIVRGLPFVASNIPPITSQLRDLGLEGGVTFNCDSPSELVEAVVRTVEEYTRAARQLLPLSETLRTRTWAEVASEYMRVFDWLADGSSKPTDLTRGGGE